MSNSKLDKLVEKFNAEKKKLQDQAKDLFVEAAKELFDEYPELKSFGWEQYAPYFNDGDPCTFSVHAHYPTINGYDSNYCRFIDDESEEKEPTEEQEAFFKKVTKPIAKLLATLPEDIMQEVFGDDTRVTITRDGKIENDETNHD